MTTIAAFNSNHAALGETMTKRAVFHQATITTQIRIVDDNRSYDLKTAQITVLMDTDLEWQIAAAMAAL